MLSVMLILWVVNRFLVPPPAPVHPIDLAPAPAEVVPSVAPARWDPLAHVRLEAVADCLERLAGLSAAEALAVRDMSGLSHIESAYRRDCRSLLVSSSFDSFVAAYGERSRAAALAFVDREEASVLEAVADPFVSSADRVAYWQVGLGRAADQLRLLSDRLQSFYTALPVDAGVR